MIGYNNIVSTSNLVRSASFGTFVDAPSSFGELVGFSFDEETKLFWLFFLKDAQDERRQKLSICSVASGPRRIDDDYLRQHGVWSVWGPNTVFEKDIEMNHIGLNPNMMNHVSFGGANSNMMLPQKGKGCEVLYRALERLSTEGRITPAAWTNFDGNWNVYRAAPSGAVIKNFGNVLHEVFLNCADSDRCMAEYIRSSVLRNRTCSAQNTAEAVFGGDAMPDAAAQDADVPPEVPSSSMAAADPAVVPATNADGNRPQEKEKGPQKTRETSKRKGKGGDGDDSSSSDEDDSSDGSDDEASREAKRHADLIRKILKKARRNKIRWIALQSGSIDSSADRAMFTHWQVKMKGLEGKFFLLVKVEIGTGSFDFKSQMTKASAWAVVTPTNLQTFVIPWQILSKFLQASCPGGELHPVSFVSMIPFVAGERHSDVEMTSRQQGVRRGAAIDGSIDEATNSEPPVMANAQSSAAKGSVVVVEEGESRRGRSPTKHRRFDVEFDANHLFTEFTVRDRRVHSVEGTTKRLPNDYRKGKDSKLWVPGTKVPFELFCRDVWNEAQMYDRGMRTFLDMVAARIPAVYAQKLHHLFTMTGPYRDENTRFSVPDLGNITPVEWLRLATPIVEGKGVANLRRAQAFVVMQKPHHSFVNFLLILQQAFLVAGIHYGWDVLTFREKLLERLPQSLNAKCHQYYLKRYQMQHLDGTMYDEVLEALEQADAWKSVARQLSAEDGNPYVAMIQEMDADNEPVVEEVSSTKAVKKEAIANNATNGSRKALLRENSRLRARLEAAEKATVPSGPREEPSSSVNVVSETSCRWCKRTHVWDEDHCYSNPRCVVPKDQRKSKGSGSKPNAKGGKQKEPTSK